MQMKMRMKMQITIGSLGLLLGGVMLSDGMAQDPAATEDANAILVVKTEQPVKVDGVLDAVALDRPLGIEIHDEADRGAVAARKQASRDFGHRRRHHQHLDVGQVVRQTALERLAIDGVSRIHER